ncbi:trypsin-like serine peptidase [Xanthobacteraceae bacterium A53D]
MPQTIALLQTNEQRIDKRGAYASREEGGVARTKAAWKKMLRVAPPELVAAALDICQRGKPEPLTLDGVNATAQLLNRDPIDLLLFLLSDPDDRQGLLIALMAKGVALEKAPVVPAGGINVPPGMMDDFIPRSRRMSCRIRVNGTFYGSGFLVGPSLVMTAWHVIGLAPAAPDGHPPEITVHLSNNRTTEAYFPPIYQSECTPDERAGTFPNNNAAYDGYHDVVLLKLASPEGVRIGYRSPKAVMEPVAGSPVALFHFPGGKDPGVGFASLQVIAGLTARWAYNANAAGGSSGGACFDFSGGLLGIHSAHVPPHRRMIPAARFIDAIRSHVDSDIAPRFLWQLDDQIVIGRDQFFEAAWLAAKPNTRIRGVRVKRLDSEAQGTKGLSFSRTILERLLERDLDAHRVIGIPFDVVYDDLLDEIARRSPEAEAARAASAPSPGLRAAEAGVQATAKSRAQALTEALSAHARRSPTATGAPGQIWWFFFENPERSLLPQELVAVEQFAAAAIRHDNLRVVLAGFELVQSPGPELSGVGTEDAGEPGFIVEVFGRVEQRDIEHVIQLAATEFGVPLTPAELDMRTRDILKLTKGAPSINGRYEPSAVDTIKAAIAADLPRLRP